LDLTYRLFDLKEDLQPVLCRSSLCAPFRETVPTGLCVQHVGLNERNFMAVKIRMKRIGAKNQPVFRIVVADGRSPRDGKFIEEIGTYWPEKKSDNVKFDLERARYWLSKGAQPSDTVASFIKKASKAAAA
jgi:small subunit ribosomal protein S16